MKTKDTTAALAGFVLIFGSLASKAHAAIIFTDDGGTLQFELTESVTFPSADWNNIGLTTGYTGSEIIDLNAFNFIGTPWEFVTSDGPLVSLGPWTLLAGRIGSSLMFNTRFTQDGGMVFLPEGVYETTAPYLDYDVNVNTVSLATWDGRDLVGVSSPISVVPETSSALLLALGILQFSQRRRKTRGVK